MILVDTSVWVSVLRNANKAAALEQILDGTEPWLTRFTLLELLQGARNERDWERLRDYLECQDFAETQDSTWSEAARIYFDLRRLGKTVRSPIDCCIAQLAIENEALLVHNDRDFETIAAVRPLRQIRPDWGRPTS